MILDIATFGPSAFATYGRRTARRAVCAAFLLAVAVPALAGQPAIRAISSSDSPVISGKPGELLRVPERTALIRSVSSTRDQVLASNKPLTRPAPRPAPPADGLANALEQQMASAEAALDNGPVEAGLASRFDTLAKATPSFIGKRPIGSAPLPTGPTITGYRPHTYAPMAVGKLFSLSTYQNLIQSASITHGVDEALVRAIIHAESAYRPKAKSHVGAGGLMQLMPATATRFGVTNRFDPAQNIQGGTKYLAWLLRRYQGNITLATAAYNAGEGAVDKYKGVPPYRETIGYVRKVGNLLVKYREALGGSFAGRFVTQADSPNSSAISETYGPAYARAVRLIAAAPE